MPRESGIPAQAAKVFSIVRGLESDRVRLPGVRRSPANVIALAGIAEIRRPARRPLAPAETPERAQTSRPVERKRFLPRAAAGRKPARTGGNLPVRTLVDAWDAPLASDQARALGHRLGRRPFAGLGQHQEVPDFAVEGVRLLDVHGVAALGEHGEARVGHHALEVEARLKTGLVLVAADDQRRQVELPPLRLEVVERRPLALVVLHGIGGADIGMLGKVLYELGEAAWVLLLEARARRVGGEPVGIFGHALLADALGGRHGILLELLVSFASGARADAGQRERQRAIGVEPAEMRRGEGAL